jgi:hypothetical protein
MVSYQIALVIGLVAQPRRGNAVFDVAATVFLFIHLKFAGAGVRRC